MFNHTRCQWYIVISLFFLYLSMLLFISTFILLLISYHIYYSLLYLFFSLNVFYALFLTSTIVYMNYFPIFMSLFIGAWHENSMPAGEWSYFLLYLKFLQYIHAGEYRICIVATDFSGITIKPTVIVQLLTTNLLIKDKSILYFKSPKKSYSA